MIRSMTLASFADNAAAFAGLTTHLLEKGVRPQQQAPDVFCLSFQGNTLELKRVATGIAFSIEALSENALYFLREAVAEHVAEIDEHAAAALIWSGDVPVADRPPNFQVLTVLRRSLVMPGLTRLVCHAPDVGALGLDGLHIKLMRPVLPGRAMVAPGVSPNGRTLWPRGDDRLHVRYFTLRALREDAGEVDIDIVHHAGGNIADWAVGAQDGDQIGVMGPGGGTTLPPLPGVFIAGDMTALPAIARLVEAFGDQVTGNLVVAMPNGVDPHGYLGETPLAVHAVAPEALSDTLRNIAVTQVTEETSHVWFGGEQADAEALRRRVDSLTFRNAGVRHIVHYWRRGQRGDATRHED